MWVTLMVNVSGVEWRVLVMVSSERNKYTNLVETYWREYFPEQVAEMPDPEAFFCRTSWELADRVDELMLDLDLRGRSEDVGYVARLGRLNAIRGQAEEIAFAEFVPTPMDEQDVPQKRAGWDEEGTYVEVEGSMSADGHVSVWIPADQPEPPDRPEAAPKEGDEPGS